MTKEEVVDLDSVLVEIGQLGKFQVITVIMVILPIIFSAFMAGEYIFTANTFGYRCYIAECEALRTAVYHPSWLPYAIPTDDGRIDQCHRYSALPGAVIKDGQCTADLFDKNRTVSCEQYVYEAEHSVVFDFGIECQEWKRVLIGTFNSIGTLLVLPITGYISDRFGRRLALTVNAANTAILGVLRAFSVNYEMYLVLNLLGTTLGDGAFSAGYILATELVGPKWRTMIGVSMNSFFGVGQVLLGLIAWAIPRWRVLTLTLYVPQLFVIAYGWIMYESVRWLLSKEYYERAVEVLKNAARINKKSLSLQTIDKLVENTKVKIREARMHQIEDSQRREPSLVTKIIKSPIMLKRMCIIPVWWVTVTLVYYGMSINAVSLAGNMYMNYILVCAVEIPGYWIAYILLDRIGRKSTLSMSFFICAICSIIFPFVSSDLQWLSLSLYMIGKLAISIVFSAVYIYTAELLPTSYRHSLLAFASMIGRIGAICAPLTPALLIYWHGIPSLIFGSMAFISGCLAFTTPDTLNIRLPDSIEDAERIGL